MKDGSSHDPGASPGGAKADHTSATELSALDTARGMRRCIVSSIFGSLFGVCVAGQFLTGFFKALDATYVQVAMLTALPMLGLALQLPATLLTPHLRRRKPYWFWLATVHRLLWFVLALIPFLVGKFDLASRPALVIFLGLFFVSSVLGSMSTPFWFSWMADLIPNAQAGRFWSRRVAMISLVNMLVIPVGWYADCFPPGDLLPFGILFLVAAVVGQVEIMIQDRVPEPSPEPPSGTGAVVDLIREPFRHRDFRRFMWFTAMYSAAVFFGDWAVVLFCLEELHLSQTFIAFAASLMWMMRWIMARYWGFLGDRFGHSVVLRVCGICLTVWPLVLAFWGTSHPKLVLLSIHLYMGFFNVGFDTAHTSLLLGITPPQNKSLYVSYNIAVAGLVAAIFPILGSQFLDWFKNHPGTVGSFDHFQMLFIAAAVLRTFTMLCFPTRFQESKGTTTAMLVRKFIDANPFKVIHHSYVLNESVQEEERVDAVRELADAGSDIASEQLVLALRDPSLEVRRGAVEALVEIGETSSIPALLAAARSPEGQIQAEAIEALGRMGDRSVTPFLVSQLEDPILRLPALRGLGSLRDPASLDAVRSWASCETATPGTRATAFEACCNLGDDGIIPPCLQFIRHCDHELPRWQAALALARMTVGPVDFYSVLQHELRVRGEMVAGQSEQLSRSPAGRERPPHIRQAATALCLKAERHYMDAHWREAALDFTLAALTCLEIVPPAVADETIANPRSLDKALLPLEKTIAELSVTRSQLVHSLRLAEALLKLESVTTTRQVSEETILACCLLRKLLGSA